MDTGWTKLYCNHGTCLHHQRWSDLSACICLQSRWSAFQIQRRVETSFEEQEFLEGAKDAWFAGTLAASLLTLLHVEHVSMGNVDALAPYESC